MNRNNMLLSGHLLEHLMLLNLIFRFLHLRVSIGLHHGQSLALILVVTRPPTTNKHHRPANNSNLAQVSISVDLSSIASILTLTFGHSIHLVANI